MSHAKKVSTRLRSRVNVHNTLDADHSNPENNSSLMQASRDKNAPQLKNLSAFKKEIFDKVNKIISLVGEPVFSDDEMNFINKLPLGLIRVLIDIICFNGLSLLPYKFYKRRFDHNQFNNNTFDNKFRYFGSNEPKYDVFTKAELNNDFLAHKDVIANKIKLKKIFNNKKTDNIDAMSSLLVTIFEKLCILAIQGKKETITDNKIKHFVGVLSGMIDAYDPILKGYLAMINNHRDILDTQNMSVASLVLGTMNHDKDFFKKANLWKLYNEVYALFYILKSTGYVPASYLEEKFNAINQVFGITMSPINFNMSRSDKMIAVVAAGLSLLALSANYFGWLKSSPSILSDNNTEKKNVGEIVPSDNNTENKNVGEIVPSDNNTENKNVAEKDELTDLGTAIGAGLGLGAAGSAATVYKMNKDPKFANELQNKFEQGRRNFGEGVGELQNKFKEGREKMHNKADNIAKNLRKGFEGNKVRDAFGATRNSFLKMLGLSAGAIGVVAANTQGVGGVRKPNYYNNEIHPGYYDALRRLRADDPDVATSIERKRIDDERIELLQAYEDEIENN